MKICDVAAAILRECPEMPHNRKTVDTFKYGDSGKECSGVAVTINATVNVIKRAAEMGCNLIISHEPTWWTHTDDRNWPQDDLLYNEKIKLLDSAGIVIWRFHDHMHMHEPDLIFSGISAQLGWDQYIVPGRGGAGHSDDRHFLPMRWELPDMKFEDVAELFSRKLGLNGVPYVGNRDAVVRKAAIAFHEFEYEPQQAFIQMMQEENIDLLIPGESNNWSTQAYIKDAGELGMNKVMLLIGHFNMETLGMKNMAEAWLPEILPQLSNIHYISAGDSYCYM